MLNNRQMRIIDILNDHNQWLTGKELAQMMNVSDRTIRSDIENINDNYQCILIEANKRFGYHLDEQQLLTHNIQTESIIPQTSQERSIWLIHELLFKNKEINLLEVQDRVFVSGYSIDNDLKKVKKIISEYPSLQLKRSKNHVFLEGNEEDKRKLYKSLLTEETQGNFLNLNSISRFWKHFDLIHMVDILNDVCDQYQYSIRETAFPMIMMHAGVAVDRIYNHNYINHQEEQNELEEKIEYKVSYDFFQRVAHDIHIEFVEDEVKRFAVLLQGKSSSGYKTETNQYDVEEIYRLMIKKLKDVFDIDLSQDEDLKVGLLTHLQSLIERQINEVNVTNIYLKEIKRKYPLVFEMAIYSGEIINEYLHAEINENELAFLALHLGSAYERVNSKNKYRVVVIIPHNQLLSKPCLERINIRFEDRMKVVGVYQYFDQTKILLDKPDLIMTTVPLQHKLKLPTVQVSLFMSYEDESKIFQALNHLDKLRYRDDFVVLVRQLMREDLFYSHVSYETPEEVIAFLCDELEEKGLAPKEYKEDVFKRENVSHTSFVYGFAVPHSIEISTTVSCISTIILDKPIQWGEFEVKLVVLLGIRDSDNHLLRIFFDWLCNIVTDSNKFAQLLESQSYEELIKQMLL